MTDQVTIVSWKDGTGRTVTVHIKPHSGTVVVDGREFELSALCSNDVPEEMYREKGIGGE